MTPQEKQRMIEALNQDVSLELGAIIQYLWHHYMAEGMESPAVIDLFEKLAQEEMKHMEQFAERVVALGGEPTTQIAPVKKGGELKKMVRDDLEGERNAIQVYKDHIRLAADLGDSTTRRMLEEVVATEEDHAALWETTLGLKPGE
jgi:bacterioferritin